MFAMSAISAEASDLNTMYNDFVVAVEHSIELGDLIDSSEAESDSDTEEIFLDAEEKGLRLYETFSVASPEVLQELHIESPMAMSNIHFMVTYTDSLKDGLENMCGKLMMLAFRMLEQQEAIEVSDSEPSEATVLSDAESVSTQF